MSKMTRHGPAALCAMAILGLVAMAAPAAAQGITVELNKLEEADGGGCRAFFLFRNTTEMTFEGFELSVAVLDGDGVIDQLLTIDAAPVPAMRTALKLFEIPGTGCAAISQVLLHEITSCRPQNADEMDCFAILDLVSRASADLVK
jgi:hypothetical protein